MRRWNLSLISRLAIGTDFFRTSEPLASVKYERRQIEGKMSKSVLLVGVDAGSFSVLDRLGDAGNLPTIERLREEGVEQTLESSVPPWTPTAWTSLASGKNPGKHGIFDFKTTDQERLVNGTDVTTSRIWEYLDQQGQSSIVLNVPVTHPAPKFDGVLVPGYLGPEVDEAIAHPDGVLDELREHIGEYRVYVSGDADSDEERCDEFLDLMQMRVDAARYLCDAYDWDFAMVQFQRTDTVFHELPDQRYIDRVYRKLDECVKELTEELDPDTTLIVSDHGMGELGNWDFRLNSWLHQRGYLETSNDGFLPGWEKPVSAGDDETGGLQRAVASAARFGLSVQRIERVLNRVGMAGTVQSLVPDAVLTKAVEAGSERIDREASMAYCPSGPGLGIYCEPDVLDDVVARLSDLEDPDGRQVFEWVRPAEVVYDGPETGRGPDILALPQEMDYFVSGTLGANAFEPTHHSYNHEVDGICIAVGDDVAKSAAGDPADITDVAPTVLSLLETPLDPEFDGDVMNSVFPDLEDPGKEEYRHQRTEATENTYEDVEERLEDLGYMS